MRRRRGDSLLVRLAERTLAALGLEDGPSRVQEAAKEHPAALRTTPSLAQEVLVLAVDPATGKVRGRQTLGVGHAVKAAVLLELFGEGRLELSCAGPDTGVAVGDPSPVGDPVLDMAMEVLDGCPPRQRAARKVVHLPGEPTVVTHLAERGLLVEEARRWPSPWSARRVRLTPAAGRDALVARVADVLLGRSLPDERTALLIAASEPFVPLRMLVPRSQVRQARRRAREVVERLPEEQRTLLAVVRAAHAKATESDVAFG